MRRAAASALRFARFLRTRSRSAIVAMLAGAMVFAAVGLGLKVPGFGVLSPFTPGSRLDYSGGPRGGFAPLDPRYIADVLGGGLIPRPAEGGDAPFFSSPGTTDAREADPVLVSHAFNNDDFSDAYAIPSVPFTAHTQTTGATREAAEPEGCGPRLRDRTVWYRFTAPVDMGLVANTFGSNYATYLAVYRGTWPALEGVAPCDDDATGNAHVGFAAARGQTYFFQVGGAVGGGRLMFNLEPTGRTVLASVDASENQAPADSWAMVTSSNGRYVAFTSSGALDPSYRHSEQCPSCGQVFLRDLRGGTTELISVAIDGDTSAEGGLAVDLSGDGRFVSFLSPSSDLVPGDTNDSWDVFVRDRRTSRTERVSVASSGEQAEPGPTYEVLRRQFPVLCNHGGKMSDDGRYVAFASTCTNLIEEDQNLESQDVFVHDRMTKRTDLVTKPYRGRQELGIISYVMDVSTDGRYVVFTSTASNLAPGDRNATFDIFVRDLREQRNEIISVTSAGLQGDGASGTAASGGQPGSCQAISEDGRYVVFASDAANLVSGDTNGTTDVFVRDRFGKTTERVSVNSNEGQGLLNSGERSGPISGPGAFTSISPDGRFISFDSEAINLVPNDSNDARDVFLRDRATGTTSRVSVSNEGREANDDSAGGCISRGFVAYVSGATNLVPGDSNAADDVFVHEESRLRNS